MKRQVRVLLALLLLTLACCSSGCPLVEDTRSPDAGDAPRPDAR